MGVLELFEWIKYRYRYDQNRTVPSILFVIRIFDLFLIIFISNLPLDHPGLFSFLPLLAFYGYFLKSKYFSFMPVGISIGFILFSEYWISQGSPLPFQIRFAFITFKILCVFLFYLLAIFWKKDRDKSDENYLIMQELHSTEIRLREYAQKVAEMSVSEERSRIARDIHDSIGHALTAIQIQLSKAEAYFHKEPDESLNAVHAAHNTAKDAIADVRDSLTNLNQEKVDFQLFEKINGIIEQAKGASHIVLHDIRGDEEGINFAVRMGIFRCIQEGVTNVLKHACADTIEITLDLQAEQIQLILKDNGVGFDSEELFRKETDQTAISYGLLGLKRRLELIRALLEIDSLPGKGTVLKAVFPRDPVKLIGGIL